MHKRTHRVLVLSNAVMMFAAYLALVTTDAYSAATLLIPAAIFAAAPALIWLDARVPAYRLATTFVTMCVAFFLFGMWLIRAAELLHIVTWLVMYIQFYLMCHRKSVRHYYYLFLMSFFILISACAQEPEPAVAFGFTLFVLSAVWALFTLHVYAEALQNKDRSAPDIVDTGISGSIVPQRGLVVFDRNLYASIGVLSFASILLTTLLFIATPRMEAGIFGANNNVESTTDVVSEIDLTIGGHVTPDATLVMRVQFPDEPNGTYGEELFWRSTSLELYRNARWERASAMRDHNYEDQTAFYGFTGGGRIVRRNPVPRARRVHQEIYLDDASLDGLPALSFVQSMTTSAGALTWDERMDTTVTVSNLKQSSLSYEAWSEVGELDEDALRAAPGSYRRVMGQAYRVLTNHDLEPRTVALARTITKDADNAYDRAVAVRNHFLSGGYLYSLSLPPGSEFNPVDTFIHESKSGHCELYASAMALMVRSLGIPARLVTGYAGGEWNASDQAYLVRKSMAHAWVEVYFINHGWVTFDPSPPASVPELGAWDQFSRTMGRYALNAKMLWYSEVIGFEGGIQWEELRDAFRNSAKLDFSFLHREARNELSVSGFVVPLVIIWLAIAGALGWAAFTLVAYLRRRAARRQGGAMTSHQVRAQRVYGRLKRRLSKLGADCHGKTSGEVLELVSAGAAIDSGPVSNVIEVYNRARFGGYPLTRDEYQRLTSIVRRIRRVKP